MSVIKEFFAVITFCSKVNVNLVRNKLPSITLFFLGFLLIFLTFFSRTVEAQERSAQGGQIHVLDIEVATDQDDAEERLSNGRIYLKSSDLELGYERSHAQAVAIRFTNVPVPKGSTVTAAYIQFQVDEKSTGPASLKIKAQADPDAPKISKKSYNISRRATTDNEVLWNPQEWTSVGERNVAQRTPDLSSIINEVIGKEGWSAGNALAFIITGSGTRTAEAFRTRPPLLHLEYKDKTYVLNYSVQGAGAISRTPALSEYSAGDMVTVKAEPEPGWHFVSWAGDLNGTQNPETLVMDSNKEIVAVFEEDVQYYSLTVVNGSGSGMYQQGEQVEIEADPPSSGYIFDHWESLEGGEFQDVTSAQTLFTMPDGNVTVTAEYKLAGLAGYDFDCDLRTDLVLEWPAVDGKPDYLASITDSAFGTEITRIVGDPGTPMVTADGAVIGDWPDEQERHGYSKRQPWNADESMIFLDRCDNLFLDGSTYEPLFKRSHMPGRVRWSYTEPNIMHFVSNNGVGEWNVVDDVTEIKVPLSGYSGCSFGKGEGNFAWDDSRVAILATRKSDGHQVVFIADLKTGEKGQDIDLSEYNKISNCTISPYGNFIVIVGNFGQGSDRLQVRRASDGSIVFTETAKGLPSHFDTQVDQNGDEVIAGVAKSGNYSGKVIKRRLSDGAITLICDHKYASHTSGRAIGRPGWVYVTYQNRKEKYAPYLNELVAVKLDGSRTERLCHLHSMKPEKGDPLYKKRYLFEAHGVPSPSGLKVMWASDWDTKTWPVQTYVADFSNKLIEN